MELFVLFSFLIYFGSCSLVSKIKLNTSNYSSGSTLDVNDLMISFYKQVNCTNNELTFVIYSVWNYSVKSPVKKETQLYNMHVLNVYFL